MSLPVTKLDNIDFERLVGDARAQIPRYAPDWTDHNLHDPGITLIELVAWIVDQEIYRVGFVGDRHLKAFAALLGVRPHQAAPARGLIWPASDPAGAVSLNRGRRIVSNEQPDVPFMLDSDLLLSDAKLSRTVADNGATRVALNGLQGAAGVLYVPAARAGGGYGAIELSFEGVLVRAAATANPSEIVSLGIKVNPIAGVDGGGAKSWGPIAFDYRVDDGDWQAVVVEQDRTLALARTGAVLLRIPAANGVKSALRLRLDRGFFPIAPRLMKLAINVVPVVQLDEIAEREIGLGNGMPDQTFDLDLSGVPAAMPDATAFRIVVAEGGNLPEWTAVDDFGGSKPNDAHYVVDGRRGRIRFGNRINGRSPAPNAQIIHRAFHATRGARGNLGTDLHWRADGLAAPLGINPEPMAGGEDASTIDDLIATARTQAFRRDALLTNADLKAAAERLAGFGVARADIVVRHDPALPDKPIRGARTLIVVPDRSRSAAPPGPVSPRYLDAVAERLAPRRLLGERLAVRGPSYARIDVSLRLIIAARADASDVRRRVEEALRSRLSDLPRNDAVKPWPLGRPVTRGEIKGRVAKIPGVAAVRECRLARQGVLSEAPDVPLGATEIAIAGQIEIAVERAALGDL